MPTYQLLEQDGDPIDVALRFRVPIDRLLSANQLDVANDPNWRSRWTPGAILQIPGDPLSGYNYCEYNFAASPQPLSQLIHAEIASCPLWNSGGLTAQQLWDHWANRDFRAWQLSHGGRMDNLVASSGGQNSPSLWLVHPVYGARQLGIAPGEVNTNSVTEHMDSADPPEGSPYNELGAPLRQTLVLSFRNLKSHMGGSEHNLNNAHWGDANVIRRLRTTWQALDRFEDTALNSIVKVYQRISNPRAADEQLQSTWSEVRWIQNAWYGGCIGFRFVPFDQDGLVRTLRSAPTLAEDFPSGKAEHEPGGPLARYSTIFFSPSTVDCWREVAVPVGSEGLHFCIPRSGGEHMNIHIDWQDPCEARDAQGMCDYDYGVSIPHWFQAMLSHGVPVSPFAAGQALVDRLPTLEQRIQTMQNTAPAPVSSTPDTTAGVPSRPRRTRGEMLLGVWQIRSRWQRSHRLWAARGYGGWNSANEFVNQSGTFVYGIDSFFTEVAAGRAVIDP